MTGIATKNKRTLVCLCLRRILWMGGEVLLSSLIFPQESQGLCLEAAPRKFCREIQEENQKDVDLWGKGRTSLEHKIYR